MSIFDLKVETGVSKLAIDGKSFYLKHWSAIDRDRFEQQWISYKTGDSVQGIRAFAVVFSLCNDKGELQHPSGPADKANNEFLDAVEHANKLPASIVGKLADCVFKTNKVSASDVEELEGN